MITDELSYYFQAKNWLEGNKSNTIIDAISGTTYSLIEGHYPPGNSFINAGLLSISPKLLNFVGLLYLIGSILLLHRCLRKKDLPLISLSILYLYLPLIFISRTTMSEMPSLLLVAFGMYLFYQNKSKSYLWLAFITGLCIAFRETNLLLLAPLAFFISKNYFYSLIAFLCGVSFRLIGYYHLKSDALFVKEGYPFGMEYIPDTLIIYSIILLILLPLSPFWFKKVPREELKPFSIALLSFLALHLLYGYVAHVYSGYTNGLLLNGRFWIPSLPIFVMAMGYLLKEIEWINNKWIQSVIIMLVAIIQFSVHYKSNSQQSLYIQFSDAIHKYSEDHLTFIDMNNRTPIYRYIYPFVLQRKWSDINLMNDNYHLNQMRNNYSKFRIAIISSGATVAQSSRNAQFHNMISDLRKKYNVQNILELCPDSNTCLNIYEVKL